MFNPLFISSVLCCLTHGYLFLRSSNSFLLLPLISTITSIMYHDINSNYNCKNLKKLDVAIVKITVLWNFLWILSSDLSHNIKYSLITNIIYSLFYYSVSFIVYNFYNRYYNFIGLHFHILSHIVATWSNATISLAINNESDDILFKIGYTMCILGICNIIFRYIFRVYAYNTESYCTDYSSKITSAIFQVVFCYFTMSTILLYRLKDQSFQSKTIRNISMFCGYFGYDIISLLTSYRGSTQKLYLAHHVASLYLTGLLYLFSTSLITLYYLNMLGFIFELASPFLNMMKLLKRYNNLYIVYLNISKILYFISRMLILPILIVFFYKDNVNLINPYVLYQVLIGLTGLCGLSTFWFVNLFAIN